MAGPGGAEVGRISIRVVPNTDRFREELKAQLEAIEKSLKGQVDVKANLDENGIREKFRALTSSLKGKAEVKVDVDRSALDRLKASGGGFGGGGGSFGGLGSFADTAAIAAAVAALAAPALALLSGALATIPGVLAAILVPIGAVALGLDGLKKAAQVLTQPIADLKTTMSQRFQDVFTPILTKATALFPALQASLPNVANGLGRVADAFVSTITSGPGLDRIKGTIDNIANSLAVSAPGITSFTNGLLSLAQGVTAKFPAVSQWIQTVGDSFSGWTAKVIGDGSLDRAMGNLGEVLKGFGEIGVDALKQGFDFLQDPKFADSMKGFVADIKDLVNGVLPGLKGFFQDLSGSISGISGFIKDAKSLADSLPDWVKRENPTNQQKQGDSVIPKGGVVDKLRQPDWFIDKNKIQDAFKNSFVGLNLGETIAPAFKGVNDFIQAPIQSIVDFFKTTVGTGMASAAADTGPLVGGQLAQGLGQGLQQGVPALQATITASTQPLLLVPAQIQQAFSGIGAAVTGSMAVVVSSVAGAGSQIVSAFTSSLAQIPGIATNTFSQVAVAAQGGMIQVVAVIQAGAQQSVAAVQAMGQQIIAALQQAATGARAAGAQVGAGMAAGIRESTGGAVAAAQALAAAVTAAAQVKLGIHSPSKVFTEIGAQTAQGLQDGIDGGFQGVVDRATALAQAITDAVNNGLTGVDGSVLNDQLKRQMAEIGLESDVLKNQLNATDDKGQKTSIRDQRSQLQTLKDQLNLQQDQLGFSQKYGDSVDQNTKGNDVLGESLNKMVEIGKGFAMANANQFMSDLGISGQGAIPTLANIGLDWASGLLSKAITGGMGGNTNIHVNSIDEGLAARQNIQNKKALQYTQR